MNKAMRVLGIVLASGGVLACRGEPSEEAPAAEVEENMADESAKAKPASAVSAEREKPAEGTSPAKEVTADGYEVIRAKAGDGKAAEVAVQAPPGWKVAQPPTVPDPHAGKFGLSDALAGLKGKGPLVATMRTSLGTLYCDLYEDKAPVTVANFAGLARGTRSTWQAEAGAWVKKPYYDGTTFHRVIPGFMIQGGDWKGDGSGDLWYTIPDELHPSLKHDKAGQLCMANRGPNTNEAQFFITDGAAPHLDTSYTIFGQCTPTDVVNRIARVTQSGPPNNRPLTPVVIDRVTVERRAGGAAAAQSAPKAEAPAKAEPTAAETKPAGD
jgi:peptidyl-prolyl cis-trans isomerase A (cyclophilin A)